MIENRCPRMSESIPENNFKLFHADFSVLKLDEYLKLLTTNT
jgi:hypothetical protein